LQRNASAWATAYRQAIDAGEQRSQIPQRFRHKQIKDALRLASSDKCIYCESKISGTQFGDIEHIIPVSLRPDLVVDWNNLGFVCQRCNNSKRDYWHPTLAVIDPYTEEPVDFLMFLGPIVIHLPSNMRGQITVRKLDLNRIELVTQRAERLNQISPLIDRIGALPAGPERKACMQFLAEEHQPSSEYSAMVAAFVDAMSERLDASRL